MKKSNDNSPDLRYYAKDINKLLFCPIEYTGKNDDYQYCLDYDGFYECIGLKCDECLRCESNRKYLLEYIKKRNKNEKI